MSAGEDIVLSAPLGPDVDGRMDVDVAWAAVMDEVKVVAKRDRNDDQHFNFRGIDAVVNAMGPAMRKYGVKVIPHRVEMVSRTEYETKPRYEGKSGTRMVNTLVKVVWHIRGPRGDVIEGESIGEAADAGDKGVTKAQSVAWRVFLIQAGALPTDDQDPDSESHERASHAVAEGEEDVVPAHIQEAIAAADAARGALLAALEWFTEYCDEHPDWTRESLCNGDTDSAESCWLESARAAIAAAKVE